MERGRGREAIGDETIISPQLTGYHASTATHTTRGSIKYVPGSCFDVIRLLKVIRLQAS